MAHCRQASISNGTDTAIKATDFGTTKITVGEHAGVNGWPTTDLTIKKSPGDAGIQVPGGIRYSFEKGNGRSYQLGETVGFVQPSAAVTTTLAIDEEAAS